MNLAESKAVHALKMLGSNKEEYKAWNGKLLNAVCSVLGQNWRKYLHELNKKLDVGRKVLEADNLQLVEGYQDLEDFELADENLYYVMMEKTEGEASLRVLSGEPGKGFEAYMKIHLWYAGTTSMAM